MEFVKKLPVEVKESHISSIALQVQWRNLWNGATDAINLHIEGMTLHIVPIERNTQKNFMGDSLTDSLTAQIQQELQEELAEELRNREFQAFKIDHEDNEATGFFQSQIQSVLERIYDQIRIVVNDIAIFLRHTNQEFDPPESEFSLRIPKLEFLNEKQDKIDSSGNPATRLKMIHLPEFRINCRTNYLDSSTEETILSCSFQQSISIKLSKSMNELNRSKTTISAVVESIKLGLSPTHLKLGLNLIIALSELFNLEQQDQFSDFELRNEDGVHDQNVSLDEIDLQKSPQFVNTFIFLPILSKCFK